MQGGIENVESCQVKLLMAFVIRPRGAVRRGGVHRVERVAAARSGGLPMTRNALDRGASVTRGIDTLPDALRHKKPTRPLPAIPNPVFTGSTA